MIDADLVPVKGTDAILTAPGEVVYCGYAGRSGGPGHWDTFGCGCFRASRAVYESMAPPWFDLTCNSSKTQRIGGESQFFAGRLRTKPRRVGAVGRATDLVIIPKDEGQGYRIISPVNLRAEMRGHWPDEWAGRGSSERVPASRVLP